jgi:hypothetical protein
MTALTYLKFGSVAVLVIYLVAWGDRNGFNAQKMAKIERELIAANAAVKSYSQRDDQAAVDADTLRDEGYRRALADLGSGDKCVVTETMARALGRINQ